MVDAIHENLRRYRAERAPHIGTPHGQATKILLGWDPPDECGFIFFDDGVRLDSTQPAVKLYNAGVWDSTMQVRNVDSPTGNDDMEEIILKLSEPVDEIRVIDIGLSNGSAAFDPPDSTTQDYALDATFVVDLIKVPLDSGTFNLADLTWNNANRDSGTLFATPGNFEAGGTWYGFDSDATQWGTATDPPPQNFTEQLTVKHINLPLSAAKKTGPYYGIIIHISETQIIPGVSINSASAAMVIQNTRPTASAEAERSWILGNGPFV